MSDLKPRDRRSAKEWKYVNCCFVNNGLGLAALGVAKDQADDVRSMTQKLALADKSMCAAFEVLSMRVLQCSFQAETKVQRSSKTTMKAETTASDCTVLRSVRHSLFPSAVLRPAVAQIPRRGGEEKCPAQERSGRDL